MPSTFLKSLAVALLITTMSLLTTPSAAFNAVCPAFTEPVIAGPGIGEYSMCCPFDSSWWAEIPQGKPGCCKPPQAKVVNCETPPLSAVSCASGRDEQVWDQYKIRICKEAAATAVDRGLAKHEDNTAVAEDDPLGENDRLPDSANTEEGYIKSFAQPRDTGAICPPDNIAVTYPTADILKKPFTTCCPVPASASVLLANDGVFCCGRKPDGTNGPCNTKAVSFKTCPLCQLVRCCDGDDCDYEASSANACPGSFEPKIFIGVNNELRPPVKICWNGSSLSRSGAELVPRRGGFGGTTIDSAASRNSVSSSSTLVWALSLLAVLLLIPTTTAYQVDCPEGSQGTSVERTESDKTRIACCMSSLGDRAVAVSDPPELFCCGKSDCKPMSETPTCSDGAVAEEINANATVCRLAGLQHLTDPEEKKGGRGGGCLGCSAGTPSTSRPPSTFKFIATMFALFFFITPSIASASPDGYPPEVAPTIGPCCPNNFLTARVIYDGIHNCHGPDGMDSWVTSYPSAVGIDTRPGSTPGHLGSDVVLRPGAAPGIWRAWLSMC